MPFFSLISALETLLFSLQREALVGEGLKAMFEEIVSDAVQMLILLFWVMLAFIIIWGALWTRAINKAK